MALIPCVECGREVSDQAGACPNCGHPVKPRCAAPIPEGHLSANPGSKGRNAAFALVIVLVVVVAVIASCWPSRDHSKDALEQETSRPSESPEQRQARLIQDTRNDKLPLETRLEAARSAVSLSPDSPEGKEAAELVPRLEEQLRKATLGKQWDYRTNDDPMTGKKAQAAFVLSSNTHEFKFPYATPQHAMLSVRRHPQHGNDIILRIERGQLQCPSYSGCTVMVRFGEATPRTFRASGPADGSTETLFIEGYSDFLRRMQAVDVVRIQASVYQEGSPTWTFDVSGFDPDRMK
ncbi:hypothetical protein I5V28_16145 [Stenotrophomonas maltophilia]|uniref:hypothetical protein n=1 Tax=Stenotrophomonas maltophilia group sp. Smal32 TaxID=3377164 RepID=UPI0018D349AE|nr:hypothetical protein [Stenotrophomonas maltophilia]MBH1747348.1 hypothetical protein [Stenotrophomonas maltophilia]